VCRRFVALCRDLKLFSQALIAIDGSKFKAVNTRDKNFTVGKIDKRQQQIEESIHRYLVALDTADRTQPAEFEARTTRLKGKIEQLRQQMRALDEVKVQVRGRPDGQLSKTDPDARSMATSGRGSGIVGYNVQVAVDAKHHLIVAHEVTNFGHDRVSLAPVAQAAREAMGKKRLRAIAGRASCWGLVSTSLGANMPRMCFVWDEDIASTNLLWASTNFLWRNSRANGAGKRPSMHVNVLSPLGNRNCVL